MKRWIPLILVFALVLSGCAKEGGAQTTGAPAPSEPTKGLYDPENLAQQQSGGAVRAYPLGNDGVNGILPMGEDILVFSASSNGGTTLIRLEGENKGEAARAQLSELIVPTDSHVQVSYSQLAYYSADSNSVVFLDQSLKETRRVQMPDGMVCAPLVSEDMQRIFYCMDTEIRIMELGSGISRLLKQHNCQSQNLKALHFAETLLEVEIQEESGTSVAFVSTENGETLSADKTLTAMETTADMFLVQRREGVTREVLIGKRGEEPQSLRGCDYSGLYSAPSMKAFVTKHSKDGLKLYSMETGKATAAVWFDGADRIFQLVSDPYGQYLWFLAQDPKGRADTLYRWEPALSPVQEDTVYLAQRFTKENPDVQGLADCRAKADTLEQTYGVKISLEVGQLQAANYAFTEEYLAEAFRQGLVGLEDALFAFPEGFFTELGKVSASGKLNILLVRDLQAQTENAIQTPGGLQFWIGSEAYIALEISDDIRGNFYHQLSNVLDTYVFARSVRYDDWEELNPDGFRYDGNYVNYQNRQDTTYLTDGDRAFVDAQSMTYPREDRAAIFRCAIEAGNAALFQNATMQAKLKTVCDAMRDAFGWKNSEEVFRWEQYLQAVDETA